MVANLHFGAHVSVHDDRIAKLKSKRYARKLKSVVEQEREAFRNLPADIRAVRFDQPRKPVDEIKAMILFPLLLIAHTLGIDVDHQRKTHALIENDQQRILSVVLDEQNAWLAPRRGLQRSVKEVLAKAREFSRMPRN
jgi:hypothetical protein